MWKNSNMLEKNLMLRFSVNHICKKVTFGSIGRTKTPVLVSREYQTPSQHILNTSPLHLYITATVVSIVFQNIKNINFNTTVHLLTRTKPHEHIAPTLQDFLCLTFESRIILKILLIAYKILQGLVCLLLSLI